jgi:hypothetical protein
VLEEKLGDLVPRVGISRRRRAVQRHHALVVARSGIDLGAPLDQQSGGLGLAEEARQSQWLEAVIGPGIGERGVPVEKDAQAVDPSNCRRLEHVELGVGRKQHFDSSLVSAVDSVKKL